MNLPLFRTSAGGSDRRRPTSVRRAGHTRRQNPQNPFSIVTRGLTNHRIGLPRLEHKEIVNALSLYFSCAFTTHRQAGQRCANDKLMNPPIDRPRAGQRQWTSRLPPVLQWLHKHGCHTGVGLCPSEIPYQAARSRYRRQSGTPWRCINVISGQSRSKSRPSLTSEPNPERTRIESGEQFQCGFVLHLP